MIEIISYQEFKGNNKDIVDNEFKKLIEKIENKYSVEILSIESNEGEDKDETVQMVCSCSGEEKEEEELYAKLAEINIKFNSFKEYIEYCLNYGADLDVLEPSKLKLSSKEFGDAIAQIIGFFKEFCNKYGIGFNVHIKEEDENIDIEQYKKGIYDEDELFDMGEDGLIRIKAVFEGIGDSENDLIKKIVMSLNDEILVHKITTKTVEIEDDKIPEIKNKFYGVIGVEMLCKPFDIVEIAYKFLPIVVSIENKEIELSGLELQDIGNDLGGAIFELSHGVINRSTN
ncbi:hypothetical protein [Methanococcus aeolicus]|uniref:Uncharacterized protein n=1 Tax=Methanococcus aeolicus (strain ATCC BAA-1280 / DSM 17508 / OCM 812 / Nankai-3) TaxID=419665 RepID=A6UTI6_META3|nr:hypothetical protein [Methanococcus aeolicus]ABR55808.1 conserved hypothetical protein [Methanococcus aeolicus Nankai-3]UXM84088.1 hypothetical protein N6C89_04805 [Methanococcus aeolicus]